MKPSPAKRLTNVFILSCSLVGLSGALAQDAALSPQDIQANWVGKTMVGMVGSGPSAGKTVEFTMNSDGTASVSGAATDTGTWRLSEQGYCATWKNIRKGQERCFTVLRKGDVFQVFNPDGSLNTTVSQVK